MIFEFMLDPIEKVQPWGEPNNLSLSWFGLTQGIYRIKVGDEFLLNYTNEFSKYLSEKYPQYNNPVHTFVDYYIVRLWEDILEILPTILEPVPKEFQQFLSSDYKNYLTLSNRADKWYDIEIEKGRDKDKTNETIDSATFWLNERWLDSGYLLNSPNIWIWSDETDVIISWDNSQIKVEEIPVWTATCGNYRVDKNTFIEEICRFNYSLFEQMSQRVEEICRNWQDEKVKIDFEQLKSEQRDRATWLEINLKNQRLRQTDWSKVTSAINRISA